MQALVFLHACRMPIQKAGGGPQAAAARKEALRSKQVTILPPCIRMQAPEQRCSATAHRVARAPVCLAHHT